MIADVKTVEPTLSIREERLPARTHVGGVHLQVSDLQRSVDGLGIEVYADRPPAFWKYCAGEDRQGPGVRAQASGPG